MDIPYPLTEKDFWELRKLNYSNNPVLIVLLDSANPNIDLDAMDTIHKSFGAEMYAFHYFINKLGKIYGGRPEQAMAANITLLMSKMFNGTSAITDVNADMQKPMDSLGPDSVFAANKIFICVEGDTLTDGLTDGQRTSIINLSQDIASRHRNIVNTYSLRELIPQYKNFGDFVDMNSLRSDINRSIVNMYDDLPSGEISYTFGSRKLFYDADKPLTGNDIKALKTYLTALSITGQSDTSAYDLSTYYAVENFQKIYKLPVTGTMDTPDFERIRNLINTLNYVPEFGRYYRYLKYIPNNPLHNAANVADITKNDIYLLQNQLNGIKYTVEVTGEYDEQTAAAVSAYERDNNLLVNGEVGPATWQRIMNSTVYTFTGIINLENPPYAGPEVKYIQNQIKKVQRKYNISAISLSGKYDTTTSNNVKKIQMMNNLAITGSVDEVTWTLIDGF